MDYLIRIPRLGKYKDRYILITGCDTGFGHEAAKRFDALGCHVFAGCLTEAGETELRKVCSQNLLTISLDISKHESVLHAYEVVCRHIPKGKGRKIFIWPLKNLYLFPNYCKYYCIIVLIYNEIRVLYIIYISTKYLAY